jgi:hypothetical protein
LSDFPIKAIAPFALKAQSDFGIADTFASDAYAYFGKDDGKADYGVVF